MDTYESPRVIVLGTVATRTLDDSIIGTSCYSKSAASGDTNSSGGTVPGSAPYVKGVWESNGDGGYTCKT